MAKALALPIATGLLIYKSGSLSKSIVGGFYIIAVKKRITDFVLGEDFYGEKIGRFLSLTARLTQLGVMIWFLLKLDIGVFIFASGFSVLLLSKNFNFHYDFLLLLALVSE